jgi:hypothetical protein
MIVFLSDFSHEGSSSYVFKKGYMLDSFFEKIYEYFLAFIIYFNKPSQKCRLRSRTRREPMKKRSIHGEVCEHFEEARNAVIGR